MAVIHMLKNNFCDQQNKKEHLPPKSSHGDLYDAQLGQVLFYLVAHQIRATVVPKASDGAVHGQWTRKY